MDLNPICHPSPAKKMKCSFLGYIQLLMISQAGRWTQTPSATPLQPKKIKCSLLGYIQLLMIAGADQLTQTPSTTPRHPKKMKCPFLDYIQILMISQVGPWTRTASATHLQPKNEMLIFGICSTSDDRPGWLMDSNPICHPSPAKKMKSSFLDYIQLLMIGRAGRWT